MGVRACQNVKYEGNAQRFSGVSEKMYLDPYSETRPECSDVFDTEVEARAALAAIIQQEKSRGWGKRGFVNVLYSSVQPQGEVRVEEATTLWQKIMQAFASFDTSQSPFWPKD